MYIRKCRRCEKDRWTKRRPTDQKRIIICKPCRKKRGDQVDTPARPRVRKTKVAPIPAPEKGRKKK